VLSVQSEAAHAWQAPEVALVNVMAALFATTMEVEALKIELARAKEMLDLTAAVMEDHALESPGTGLPTRRYLDVWCKTNLSEARRRREVIALATWIQPPMPDRTGVWRSWPAPCGGWTWWWTWAGAASSWCCPAPFGPGPNSSWTGCEAPWASGNWAPPCGIPCLGRTVKLSRCSRLSAGPNWRIQEVWNVAPEGRMMGSGVDASGAHRENLLGESNPW